MTVKELKEYLKQFDDDVQVVIPQYSYGVRYEFEPAHIGYNPTLNAVVIADHDEFI